MKKEILMILSSDLLYPYLDGRVYKEAKSLVKNGFCVTVLCKGYKKGLPEVEMYNGIKIVRLFSRYGTTNSFFVLKIISYFDFILKFIWNGLKIVCDYIHCHDVDTLPIGVGIKLFSFKKLVYDTHELATKRNKPKYHEVIFTIIEKLMFRFCDIIISANDSRIEIMKKLYPKELKNKRLVSISNFPEIEELNHNEIRKTYREKYRLRKDEIVFLYQGGLGEDYGISEIIEAVNLYLLKNREKIKLFVLGGGDYLTKLKIQVKKLNLEKVVIFTNYIKKEEVIKYDAMADVGLVAYKNTCLNRYYCAPNKLYEYMLAKCAVLGPNFPGMIKDIEGNEIGKTCDFSNPDDIAEKLNWFIDNKETVEKMKQRAYTLVIEKYNWENETKKLCEQYKKLGEEYGTQTISSFAR